MFLPAILMLQSYDWICLMNKFHAPAPIRFLVRMLASAILLVTLVVILDIGCVFRTLTGIPCPGCGSTRAWLAFLRGDVITAFFYHPLFLLSGLILAVAIVRGGFLFRSEQHSKWIATFLVLLYLSVYAVRMMLLFPHTPPMDFYPKALLGYLYRWVVSLMS